MTTDKSDLRYKYKIKRKYFQHSAREVAEGAIADNFLQAYGAYEKFFVYYSYAAEADTHALIDRLLSLGKRVYLPRVRGKDMEVVPYRGGEELTPNGYGIPEPRGQAYDGEADVCVTPLLAVNRRGDRLGYGGGYYDRYFIAHPGVKKVGVGFWLQYTDELCGDEGDVPLDAFVCERGIINFGE